MRDWARRRAHLKVPLGRRLCDCSECHDRSESCTCFCILYWASPCQHLYSSYLLHCTSTSLDQQTGFPLSSCLLSCSQSRKSLYRAWIDRSRLLKYIHLHYVWHDIFPICASASLKPGKVKVRVTSSAGDHLGETWFECLDKTRDMFEKLKDDPDLQGLFFTLWNHTTPGLLLRCSILIVMMLILASSSTRYQ